MLNHFDMSMVYSNLGVPVPDEDRTWSLTPVGVRVPDEDHTWSFTPVGVRFSRIL